MKEKLSGKDKVLKYLTKNKGKWLSNQELRLNSGLDDVPRTIRLLRQEGWQIEVRGDGYNRLVTLKKLSPRGERKPISKRLRYLTLHKYNYRCNACGRRVEDGVKLEVDHITPVDWGGETELVNLQPLCQECNSGKQAWVSGESAEKMKKIISQPTIEKRIESLFDNFPNEDIPSTTIQLVSKGSLDWQRALRKVRERTGKKILPTQKRTAYRYYCGFKGSG